MIDTGIAPHDGLRVLGGKNCSQGQSYADGYGHGTHVAGIIGAKKHGTDPVATLRHRQALVARTVDACPSCVTRLLGLQRCPDCDDPVLLDEFLPRRCCPDPPLNRAAWTQQAHPMPVSAAGSMTLATDTASPCERRERGAR